MIKTNTFEILDIKESLKKLNKLDLIKRIYSTAIKFDLPFIFWKDDINNIYFMTDFSNNYIIENINTINNGFIFSTFNSKEKSVFIKNNLLIKINDLSISIKNITPIIEIFLNDLKLNTDINNFIRTRNKSYISYTKEDFCSLVEKTINKIKSSNISKIVTSRTLKKDLKKDFSVTESFYKMTQKYNDAFVYLISTVETGTWMGATPEILLKQENNYYRTMSLAGTQKYIENIHINDYKWSDKEIQEQKTVTDYIREILDNKNLKYSETDLFNTKAGSVIHLRTDFKITNLNNINQFNDLVTSLHPTPAVCGLPKDKSMSFIIENELHDRDFYTGFLGTINVDNNSHLRVNLRCMEISKDNIILYLGCGINKDSNPEKEWIETEIKAETLLSVI